MTDEQIQSVFRGTSDFETRTLRQGAAALYAYFLDGLVSGELIADYIYKPIVQLPFPLVLSKSMAKSQAEASQISWTEPSIDIKSALRWCSWGPISYTSSYGSPNNCPIVGI